MSSDRQTARERIPLLVAGSLEEEEAKALERVVADYPELGDDLAIFEAIREEIVLEGGPVPEPSPDTFLRIQQRVAAVGRSSQPEVQPAATGVFRDFLRTFFHTPAVPWTLAVAQCVILIALFIAVPRGDDGFTTLSSRAVPGPGETVLNVVFFRATTVEEVATVLNRVKGRVVGGPTPEGLWRIAVGEESTERVIGDLLKDPGVQFVEPEY